MKKHEIPSLDINKYDYKPQKDACFLYGYRNIDGLDFYVYNSAWDCLHNDKKDKGNLRIGPIRRSVDQSDEKAISISLVHHPEDWLSVEAVSSIRFRKEDIADQIDIAVHGHMHTANIFRDEDCNVLFVQLPTWASSDTDFLSWMSYIVKIDLDDLTYKRMSIFWHREKGHPYPSHVDTDTVYQLRTGQKLNTEIKNGQNALEELCRMLQNKLVQFTINASKDLLQIILELINTILKYAAHSVNPKMVHQLIDTETIGMLDQFYAKANNTLEEAKDEMTEFNISNQLVEDAKNLLQNFSQGENHTLTLR